MRILLVAASTIAFAGIALAQQAPVAPGKTVQAPVSVEKLTISPAAPEHPITPAQVHEIMQLSGAHQLAVQMMRGIMVNMRGAFPPYVPKDVIDDIQSSLEKMDFEPMAIESYERHVSTEDAAQIIAFYKTPAGRRFIGVMPQVTKEMQESGAKAGTQIVQEVIDRHMDEIKAAAAKYRDEHSDTPTVTGPN
jgi:hypothetical protein